MLLSHAKHHNASAAVAKTAPTVTTSALARVNQAFDTFSSDFTQARAVYYSTITPGASSGSGSGQSGANTSSDTKTAFQGYITNRIQLLGQQLNSAVVQAIGGAHTTDSHLQAKLLTTFTRIVKNNVNGAKTKTDASGVTTYANISNNNNNIFNVGTLGQALIGTVPDQNASTSTSQIDALSQDQAIAVARIAVINGFVYAKNTVANSKNH